MSSKEDQILNNAHKQILIIKGNEQKLICLHADYQDTSYMFSVR